MRNYRACVLLIFALLLIAANPIEAMPEPVVSDPDVVHHAELIVVAHIKEGSIVHVPRLEKDGRVMGGEDHTTLVIVKVLKGTYTKKELPIIIHSGLSAGVTQGVDVSRGPDPYPYFYFQGGDPWKKARPGSIITIYDMAPVPWGGPIIGDIRKDQIWFLRVQSPEHQMWNKDESTTAPGIWYPKDVQPLDLKPYFLAFLGDHPEEKLKEYVAGESPLAIRTREYLEHFRIEQIMKEPDLAKRAEMLLPFCLYTDVSRQAPGPTQREAMFQISAYCGQAGLARLVAVYKDPTYAAMQNDIIFALSGDFGAQARDAVPVLTETLKSENAFWAGQTRAELDAHYAPTPDQSTSRELVRAIVGILGGNMADPGARPILEETKALWGKLFPKEPNNEITKACDEALSEIRNEQERKQSSKAARKSGSLIARPRQDAISALRLPPSSFILPPLQLEPAPAVFPDDFGDFPGGLRDVFLGPIGPDVVQRFVDESVEPLLGRLAGVNHDDVSASGVGVRQAERALASQFFLHGLHAISLLSV